MIRIYSYPGREKSDLPTEEVWLEEDHVVSNMEYVKKWNKEHGLEDEYAEDSNRNFQVYECRPWDGTAWENDERNAPYDRIKFERKYTLEYYEYPSVEDFLVEHPEEEVLFHRGHFFLKTWMD